MGRQTFDFFLLISLFETSVWGPVSNGGRNSRELSGLVALRQSVKQWQTDPAARTNAILAPVRHSGG